MTLYYTDEMLKPERQHYDDGGVDLKASENIELPPKELKVVRTGVKAEIPFGYVGLLKDRSSLASKGLMSFGGVIDSGYRGEIKALLINTGDETMKFKRGDRIIQLITARIDTTVYYHKGEPDDETDRGENGFGSSGLRNGKYVMEEER